MNRHKSVISKALCVLLCALMIIGASPAALTAFAASAPTIAYSEDSPGIITVTNDDGSSSYVWYRAKYDKTTKTWSDFEELTPTASPYNKNDMSIDPERGAWLNLAVDGGGETESEKYKYKAAVSGSTSLVSSELEQTEFYSNLLNGNFEAPVIGEDDTNTINQWSTSRQYPTKDNTSKTGDPYSSLYWRTSATDNAVEIITVNGTALSGTYSGTGAAAGTKTNYGISTSPEGNQFAEINAEAAGSLYQKVLTYPGSDMFWSLDHSVRLSGDTADAGTKGTDTMYLVIDSANSSSELSGLTTTAQLNTKIESLLNGKDVYENNGLYIEKIADTRDTSTDVDWFKHSGTYKVPEGQYVTRFYFVSADSSQMACNNNTYGNFIDAVAFSVNYPVDENSAALIVKKTVSGLSAKRASALTEKLRFNVKYKITDKNGDMTTETVTYTGNDFAWKTNADGSFSGLLYLEHSLLDENGDAVTVNYEITESNYSLENFEVSVTKNGFLGTLTDAAPSYSEFINAYTGVGGADLDDPMEITKQIDAFRDKTDNADTTLDNTADAAELKDLYRLYLTASGAAEPSPADIVFVIDRSPSMDKSMSGGTASTSDPARDTVVSNILNGANGLISTFLSMNSENKVSVVSYYGASSDSWNYSYTTDSSKDLDWTDAAAWNASDKTVDCSAKSTSGDNFSAGLSRAYDQFKTASTELGRQRIMVFLTDGEPTYANSALTSSSGGWGNRMTRYGNGTSTTTEVQNYTKSRFDDFNSSTNNSVITYPVYIGESSDVPSVLTYMAQNGNGGALYSESSAASLKTALCNAATSNGTRYSNVSINEQLSAYVDFASQLDMRVKLVNTTAGVSHEVYYRDSLSSDGTVSKGIDTLTGDEADWIKSVTVNRNTKTVTVDTVDGVFLVGKWQLVLSFNVKATDEVYSDYEEIGYTDIGESDTDYLSNTTSSARNGFRSNKTAFVTYTRNNDTFTVNYPHPVVQADFNLPDIAFKKVNGENIDEGLADAKFNVYRKSGGTDGVTLDGLDGKYVLFGAVTSGEDGTIVLTDAPDGTYYFIETQAPSGYLISDKPFGVNVINGEASLLTSNLYLQNGTVLIPDTPEKSITGTVSRHKYLDAFRDGTDNPDTDLDENSTKNELKDLYRLYLDVSAGAELKPIDLMVVIDKSGSMQYQFGSDTAATTSNPSRAAALSNILNGTSGSDGLISKFLAQNSENMLSVVSFYGAASSRYEGSSTSGSTAKQYVSNYSYKSDAGVELDWITASQWTSSSSVDCSYKNSNGTDYAAGLGVAKDQFISDTVKDNGHEKVMIFLSDGEPTFACESITGNGIRYGNGLSATGQDLTDVNNTTASVFTKFNELTEDKVTTFCIAIGSAVGTTELEKMVAEGNGGALYQSTSYDELYSTLEEIMLNGSGKYKNFAIDDVLSKYVDFADQIDLKVTLQSRDTGTEQVLCTQSTVDGTPQYYTVNGSQYVESAAVSKADGTVYIHFSDDLELIGDWHIVVSYNVKGTERIYEDYDSFGYTAVGDPDTDYGTNTTSSNKKGFFPNDLAKVSFTRNGSKCTLPFTHPVVQGIRVAPDTVVIDYGIPVDITVLRNDNVIGDNGAITSLAKAVPDGTQPNDLGYEASVLSEQSTTLALKHGTVTLNGNTVRYTPTDMLMDEEDVFWYEYKTEDNTYLYTTVTVVPAANIYYEQSFMTFEGDGWTDVGTELIRTQEEDRPGTVTLAKDANNVYGSDAAYSETSSFYSLGSAKKTTVSKSASNVSGKMKASFTFKGTGFDLFSLTDGNQGALQLKVSKVNDDGSKTAVTDGNRMIQNYYGYKYDETEKKFTVDPDSTDALYQIPVFRIRDLAYGTYTVELIPRYWSTFDMRKAGQYDVVIDAVRIYDPAGTTPAADGTIGKAYIADNEYNPEYIKLRTSLITREKFFDSEKELGSDFIPGTIFIDGIDSLAESTEDAIKTYTSAGPNNEIYLAKGQAIAFYVASGRNIRPGSLQIGLKTPSGGVSEALIMNDRQESFDTLEVHGSHETFYKISKYLVWDTSKLADGKYESAAAIILVNNSDTVLSVTSLKWTWKDNITDKSDPLNAVVKAGTPVKLKKAAEVIKNGPTQTETELDADAFKINWNSESFKSGDTATAKITTPPSITSVTVGDITLTDFVTDSDGNRIWTLSFTVTDNCDGTFDVLFTDGSGSTLMRTDGETINIIKDVTRTDEPASDTENTTAKSGEDEGTTENKDEKNAIERLKALFEKLIGLFRKIFKGWFVK